MARPLRLEFPGAVYHITSRGNERSNIYSDSNDKSAFIDILCKATVRHNWLVHAYCLMDNHYHLLIETPDGNLSVGMRELNGVYTQQYNARHGRVGHLFQGRYKAIVVEKDAHLLALCRYIALNPVRARIVSSPADWPWSSYLATTGKGNVIKCLTVDWVLGQFGGQRAGAIKRYKGFVAEGVGLKSPLGDTQGQVILGGREFVENVMSRIKEDVGLSEVPRSQLFTGRASLDELLPPETLMHKKSRNQGIFKAYYLGYKMREIAEHLKLHYTTISAIVKKMESDS